MRRPKTPKTRTYLIYVYYEDRPNIELRIRAKSKEDAIAIARETETLNNYTIMEL